MWKKLSVKELFEYSGGMKREGFLTSNGLSIGLSKKNDIGENHEILLCKTA